MPLSTSIEFPQADVRALFAQIDRAQKQVGMTMGRAIMQAMKAVSASLGTSSKVSAKVRPYKEVGKTAKGDKKIYEVETYRGVHSYKGKFKQKFTRNGALRTTRVYAKDEAQLLKFPSVAIKFSGLAKRSWKAFRGTRISSGSDPIMKAAARNMDFEARLTGDDPYARLTNRLDYITDALNGGENDVQTAIARAARGMEKSLDNQIAKKMGAR